MVMELRSANVSEGAVSLEVSLGEPYPKSAVGVINEHVGAAYEGLLCELEKPDIGQAGIGARVVRVAGESKRLGRVEVSEARGSPLKGMYTISFNYNNPSVAHAHAAEFGRYFDRYRDRDLQADPDQSYVDESMPARDHEMLNT